MNRNETYSGKGTKPYEKVIWEGEVVDLIDAQDNGVIRVRIPELDSTLKDNELPYCYPLFNFSFFRVLPKKGERVTLMLRNIYTNSLSTSKDIRYWISIVHSTVYDSNFQPFFLESNRHYADSLTKSPKKIKVIPDAKGIYANKDEISINGRNNATIFFKNSELLLRTGGHEQNNSLKFNKKNPSYILLKNPTEQTAKQTKSAIQKQTYIPPTHIIILELLSDTQAKIQVKDKKSNILIRTYSLLQDDKPKLLVELKKELAKVQTEYPKWELLNFVNELKGLPLIYSNELSFEYSEEISVEQKVVDFSVNMNVADKIFLISHLNNEFNLKQQPNLYSDADLITLAENAHPIPYGDNLIQFLDILRQVIVNHVHPYNGMKAVPEEQVVKMLNYDLTSLLNNNVLTG